MVPALVNSADRMLNHLRNLVPESHYLVNHSDRDSLFSLDGILCIGLAVIDASVCCRKLRTTKQRYRVLEAIAEILLLLQF